VCLVLSLVGSWTGCSSPAECIAGQQVACPCAGGDLGIQICGSDGTFGTCDCGPTAPGRGEALGASCATRACGAELVCGAPGFIDLCTAACKFPADCEDKFGLGAACVDGYCAAPCDAIADCADNAHCSRAEQHCLGGKAGLSDTCSENSQCAPGLTCSDTFGKETCTAPCTTNANCTAIAAGSLCVSGRGYCAISCNSSVPCPAGWSCTPLLGNTGYCVG
jgi:hypothetical protein